LANLAVDEFVDREFPMTDANFRAISEIAYSLTGIKLSDHKKNMIYGRLARRLRKLDLPDFATYIELLHQEQGEERTEFINAITTNLTSFFRENHHFIYLRSEVIPRLQRANVASKRLRIWSAGCSTGEEPYSIAMVISSFAALSTWDVKVLATDLDSNVVMKASQGIYTAERAENIPDEYRKFLQHDKIGDRVRVIDKVKNLITFKQLNLLHEWPMKGVFDVIFCRNVVIYFDAKTQRTLFDRYANILRDNGDLFIGHSESLHNICNRFKSCGRTIYQKVR
jgi:chemotaxis protein methyltransferase CheR